MFWRRNISELLKEELVCGERVFMIVMLLNGKRSALGHIEPTDSRLFTITFPFVLKRQKTVRLAVSNWYHGSLTVEN